MRTKTISVLFWTALWVQVGVAPAAQADPSTTSTQSDLIGPAATEVAGEQSDLTLKERIINLLPPAMAQGFDFAAWGWFGDLQTTTHGKNNFYDVELGLGISQTFGDNFKIAAQGNFIDADGTRRGELEQGYITAKIWDAGQTLVTAGKFNANFGVEARDFWGRTTGTTSLLFSAQPQDLIGVMVTQPIGESGFEVRPFISADFQGGYNFDQSPSGGLTVDYKPNRVLEIAATGWVGPGFVLKNGRELKSPFNNEAYGSVSSSAVVENWQGPNITGQSASTLYFGEAAVIVRPTPDLTLSAEFLQGSTSSRSGRWGWSGYMVMADYQVTDPLHIYARWSGLDDSHWLITGIFQRVEEGSCGVGYEFIQGLEGRFEYRHDFSNVSQGFDSFSVHLTFTF